MSSTTHKRKRRRTRLTPADRQRMAVEALARIQSSDDEANYDVIYAGFEAMGIAREEIRPRENVFTFIAWRANGRMVRRGQHGVKVTTWVEYETDEIDPATGKPKKGKRPTSATVFHESQTAEIDSPDPAPHGPAPASAPGGAIPTAAAPSQAATRSPGSSKPAPAAAPADLPAKLRAAADRLTDKIAHLSRPLSQRWSAKRGSHLTSRLHEAGNMERTQRALRVLADLHERGTCPWSLASLRTVNEIAPLVRRASESVAHGYHYQTVTKSEYLDQSAAAKSLQELIDGVVDVDRDANLRLLAHETKIRQAMAGLDGFFPTPLSLAARMVKLANIQPGDEVLEPSAGKGDLVLAVLADHPDATVVAIERAPLLVEHLELIAEMTSGERLTVIAADCLEAGGEVDRVVMNPPYELGQDADHVRHCYDLLKPGGRLVAIMSEGPFFRSDSKCVAFREWLAELPSGFETESLGAVFNTAEAFRTTAVSIRLLTIDKE